MRKILAKHGYEVWARWESEAEVFELFSDSDAVGYIGFAESIAEAIKIGTWHIEELHSEATWNGSCRLDTKVSVARKGQSLMSVTLLFTTQPLERLG